MRYHFEDFTLDELRCELRRHGVVVELEPQTLRLLLRLVQENGAVVDRGELFRDVLEAEFASEDALFKAVQRARRAVGDDGRSQRLIKTVAGRGYRFVGNVRFEEESSKPTHLEATHPELTRPQLTRPELTRPELTRRQPPHLDRPAPARPESALSKAMPTRRALWLACALVLAVGGFFWMRVGVAASTSPGLATLGFGLGRMAPEDLDRLVSSLPATSTVARSTLEAQRLLDQGDAEAARDLVVGVIEQAPEYPYALATWARSLLRLGDYDGAEDAALRAVASARALPSRQRLVMEAILLESQGAYEAAEQSYRTLAALFLDEPRYGLEAVRCAILSGRQDVGDRLDEAQAGMELAGRLAEVRGQILWLRALMHQNGGRFEPQAKAALALLELAREDGEGLRGFPARGLWLRVAAQQQSGALDEALELAKEQGVGEPLRVELAEARDAAARYRGEEASARFGALLRTVAEGEDARLHAEVLLAAGRTALLQRELVAAQAFSEDALEKVRRIGDRGLECQVLGTLADILADRGQFEEAETLYLESLALARQLIVPHREANVAMSLGLLHRLAGDPYRALDQLTAAESLFADLDRIGRRSIALYNLASVNISLCRLDSAREQLDLSLELEGRLGQPAGQAWALHGLSLVAFEAGELGEAEDLIDRAIALREAGGDTAGVAASQLRRAVIINGSGGRSDEAAQLVGQLLTSAFQEPSEPRILALNVRALARLRSGRFEDAEASARQAQAAAESLGLALAANLGALVAGEVALESGDYEAAETSLRAALESAERRHDLVVVLESKRLLLELERRRRAGHDALGQDRELSDQDLKSRGRALLADARRLGCSRAERSVSLWLARTSHQ